MKYELADTIDLLEDCSFGDVQIGEATAEVYAHTLAVQLGADTNAEHSFLPERHQVVFDEDPAPEDCDDLVQRLIYRTDLPYRKEHSAVRYPVSSTAARGGWPPWART